MTLPDVLKAADRAVIDGDVHGARRLIAEALERCGMPGWETISRRVGNLGRGEGQR
jgi:hypothetical protein